MRVSRSPVFLRALGQVCPTTFDLDCRLIARLHRGPSDVRSKPITGGNGFYLTGDTTNAAFISGVNERAYLQLLSRLIHAGETVYNLGANTGYTTLWIANHFKRRGQPVHVVGFEPEPNNAAWMLRNIVLNPGLSVECEAIGLGHEDADDILLYSAGVGDGAASLEARPGASAIPVRIVRLDTYQQTAARKPDWLVIDVEGHAGKVLEGGSSTLKECSPHIAVEIHGIEEETQIERLLLRLGYKRTHNLASLWGRHAIWLNPKRSTS